ncbi:UDP-3-O-(3-hydroxymyristoyl)glucosamine N-acyltransferase [Phormidium pseudopriestleyi FRX01]|uniref:UDP-3-O-acylglucosamine N-acyltransferase n=1 Tax=Phormidium pseudopriestleyi FRX01 TaxID=1759528 RepID=A0ABS3FSD8_9CYAN|nr:UDP-3-O-(3-hydroxymyristoyl)glucosamine N-acyltransferase [Phormidium pseudopriestleyi]MBO0350039.1 UDP-3-O-(3-hydroxymyristoyl)glucosamine N-acyltransferase [Phormidium pseudopriestleyi FRX01]
MKFSEIVQKLAIHLPDSPVVSMGEDPEITGVAAVEEATVGSLSYIEGRKFADRIAVTAGTALILPMNPQLQQQASDRGIAWVATEEPRLLFAHAIALFYQPFRLPAGIHPSASIHPDATLGENLAIGAFVSIANGVKIANNVCIHANVTLYPHAEIGEGTVLHANCTIHERTRIGKRCTIHCGAVIGSEGFGFVPSRSGWVKMEQSGYTVLEDGVEVGCNSNIDRPAVGETRIGENTKIDNLVQIGHGCKIGKNCALAAQVGLAGGVQLGNNVILAGQVGVNNQVKVGDGVIATAKTGIHTDIAAGAVISGFPAIPNRLWLKTVALSYRLPEIYQSLKQLQRLLGSKSN